MKRIVIFASGSGTNAENIINASVVLLVTNNPRAKVLDRCKRLKISSLCFNRNAFKKDEAIHQLLKTTKPDLIVLAGFLWKIPEFLITDFTNKIINIHPALLPKYGGKGMYGKYVHEAVRANNETETGITIHYVNENYDEGAIIFQASCSVSNDDTTDDIAAKIHKLEIAHFPKVIESLLKSN